MWPSADCVWVSETAGLLYQKYLHGLRESTKLRLTAVDYINQNSVQLYVFINTQVPLCKHYIMDWRFVMYRRRG